MLPYSSPISFACPACGRRNSQDIDVENPNWDSAVTSMSDMQSEDEQKIQCTACHESFSLLLFNHAGIVKAYLDGHPDTDVSTGEYYIYDTPNNPKTVFDVSYKEISEYLEIVLQSGDILTRMLLTQTVSALEAYLCDALINAVKYNHDALTWLATTEKTLSTQRYKLNEIGRNNEFFRDTIIKYLRDVSYHNLPRVIALYKIALKIDISNLGIDITPIYKAIKLRHHCIHRNGYDELGGKINIDAGFVSSVVDLAKEWVDLIENQILERS